MYASTEAAKATAHAARLTVANVTEADYAYIRAYLFAHGWNEATAIYGEDFVAAAMLPTDLPTHPHHPKEPPMNTRPLPDGSSYLPDPRVHDSMVCAGDHETVYPDQLDAQGRPLPDCLCPCNQCGADRGEPFYGPICVAAQLLGGCDHWTCGWIIYNHVCPVATFLDDPITQAYGLGGDMDEWGPLLRCHVCERLP